MNMPVFKEGSDISGKVIAACVGAIFAGIVSLVISNYTSQSTALAVEVRDHDLAIAALKISAANTATEVNRTEGSVAAIENTLQGLKSASDAQTVASDAIKDQLHDIQKRFAEWDSVWRPLRSPPGH